MSDFDDERTIGERIDAHAKGLKKDVGNVFAERAKRSPEEQFLAKIAEAVERHGLLIERRAIDVFRRVGFEVEHSYLWRDPEGDQALREGDVRARLSFSDAKTPFELTFVADCKRFEGAWVFAIDSAPLRSAAKRSSILVPIDWKRQGLEAPPWEREEISKQCFTYPKEHHDEIYGAMEQVIKPSQALAVMNSVTDLSTPIRFVVPLLIVSGDLIGARFSLEAGTTQTSRESFVAFLDRRQVTSSARGSFSASGAPRTRREQVEAIVGVVHIDTLEEYARRVRQWAETLSRTPLR